MTFAPYKGYMMGLHTDENHQVFRWDDHSCRILFSVCRQGNAASCNFASDKRGLRKLRVAMREMMDFVFTNFEWCDMILADVKLRSVKKLVEKLGFIEFTKSKDFNFYCLPKEVYYG